MLKYELYSTNPDTRIIKKAVNILERGGIIIYPTDTLYGIGCSLYQKKTIEKLYKIKGKSKLSPMSIICDSIQQVAQYAIISNQAFRMLKRAFPGPFTIVLEAKNNATKLMLSRQKEIGVRVPDNAICNALVEHLGHPILNTSVSIFNNISEEFTGETNEKYLNAADMVLDCGDLPEFTESSVIRLVDSNVEVLREGKGDIDTFYL